MSRSVRPWCCARAAALLVSLVALGAAGVGAEESEEPPLGRSSPAIEVSDEETTYIEAPPFPGAIDDWIRAQFGFRMVPDAPLDEGHVELTQPELRLRGNLPILDLFVLRVNGIVGTSHYQFHEGTRFQRLESGDLVLYRTGISVDGAVRLNPHGWSLFEGGEVWSLAGRISMGSEFERKAFDEGLSTTGAFGLGYRNGDVFRIALGVALSTRLAEAGLGVDPVLSARWRPVPKLTISDRGLGIRVAYQYWSSLELFVSGHRESDEYALQSRPGDELPVYDGLVLGPQRIDELTFRDRQWQVGAGFEWKHTRAFRINFEAGAVVHRKIRLHSEDLGTLYSDRADPAAFVALRVEVRR